MSALPQTIAMDSWVNVMPVRTQREKNQYIELPFRLYANDPMWVPPLRSDMKKMMSTKHNPLYAEAEIEHFIAYDIDGEVVGRISGTIHDNYNERFGHEHVFFGFFECINDLNVAQKLIAAVEAWCEARGKTKLLGPYSYTSVQDAGLLLENLDKTKPTLLQTYNPAYYAGLLSGCGLDLKFTFSTYGGSLEQTEFINIHARAKRVKERFNYTSRNATPKELNQNLDVIRILFNQCFANNHEVMPISKPLFSFQVNALKTFIDLNGIRLIEMNGKPEAFFVILPDLNEILLKLQGSVGLLDLFKLKRYLSNVKRGVIALIGANPELQGKGLGRVLAAEMASYMAQRYEAVQTMWIDDRNPASYVLAKNCGMQLTKRYGVFGKTI